MSKNTLSILKTEIKNSLDEANAAEADLKHLDTSIYNSMEDKVGQRARESLLGIRKHFSLNMDDGLKSSQRAAEQIGACYTRTEAYSRDAQGLLSRANSVVKGLGEI
jgi:hypothetical protein